MPRVEVYEWGLRDKLPVIPIPLAFDDPDAPLNLQLAFSTVFDRRGFDYVIDYTKPIQPPLNVESLKWVQTVLAK